MKKQKRKQIEIKPIKMIKLIHPLLHVYKVFESRKLKFVCLIKQNLVKQKNLSERIFFLFQYKM